jgi:pimeloyl-ACP methyl ester carboxylesterase
MKRRNKWLVRILVSLFALILVLSVVPYFIPVTTASPERTMPFPESVFTEIDGILIHYRIWKTADTSCRGKVLLVHGLAGSTFSWRNNVDALTHAGYLVLAVDLPGFGYSDRKRGIDHSQENRSRLLWQMLEQVDGTLDANIKDDLWNLVGHSMGAGAVTAMALKYPDRTRCVVFVDGAILMGGPSLGILLDYPPVGRWIEGLGRHLFLKRDRVAALLASAYGSTPADAEVDGYLKPLLLDGTEGSFVDMMRTSTQIKKDALKELAVPAAAIWGGRDSWVPLAEAYKLKTILPLMKLDIVQDAGHCSMETHSSIFNQYLVDALDNIMETPVLFNP